MFLNIVYISNVLSFFIVTAFTFKISDPRQ